jgi:prepilin-type processing-associated H-X9-DG protein
MNRPRGFTRKEFLVIGVVLAVCVALGLPALQAARERARRNACANNLQLIGLGIHNYGQANKVFPPGTICATAPVGPSNQYDVWGEAAQSGPGFYGTSFLLRIVPYTDSSGFFWNNGCGISNRTVLAWNGRSNFAIAAADIREFYCPTRRAGLRPCDRAMMLSPAWTGGGSDYGGCAGRHAAFTLQTGYNLCDATMHYQPSFRPTYNGKSADDSEVHRRGVFGRVNECSVGAELREGVSAIIVTGELQRITTGKFSSKDGWAIGGPATLFTTGAMFHGSGATLAPTDSPKDGLLMNNGFFGSPGSDHAGGANFGMADGSVKFLGTSIDPDLFTRLGCMNAVPIYCRPE